MNAAVGVNGDTSLFSWCCICFPVGFVYVCASLVCASPGWVVLQLLLGGDSCILVPLPPHTGSIFLFFFSRFSAFLLYPIPITVNNCSRCMYQPLLELPPAAATVCAAGDRLLGEAAGVLYSSSQRAAYEAHGGAVYPSWKLANRNVVGRGVRRITSTATERRGGGGGGGALHAWRQQSLKQLVRLLRPVVSLVPLLRLVLPFVVPPSANSTSGLLLSRAEYPERVTAIAFHPHRMMLAGVVDEGAGSSRVVVYDVAETKERCVLTHAFQQHASCVAWKPFSRDVLAVGCVGGVLVWSLSFGATPATTIYGGGNNNNNNNNNSDINNPNYGNGIGNTAGGEGEDQAAHCLFYRCTPHTRTTCINFSCGDGRYLACGSVDHIAVHFHDIRLPPSNASLLRHVLADGGTEDVFFADDDTFAVRLVCGASRIVLLSFPSCASTTVATPAPVLAMAPARAFGPHHFVLHCARVEGVVVAHVNPFVGVAVVALISTGVHRGVGGSVRGVACSGRRVYIAVETGHVLVSHCGHRAGSHTLIPIGVAQLDAHRLAVFEGCTTGSLLAAVERDQTVTFLPSYHA